MNLLNKWASVLELSLDNLDLKGINNAIHISISCELQSNCVCDPYRKYILVELRRIYKEFSILYNSSDVEYKLPAILKNKCIDHIILTTDCIGCYNFRNQISELLDFESLIGVETIYRKLVVDIFDNFKLFIYKHYKNTGNFPIFYIKIIDECAYFYLI